MHQIVLLTAMTASTGLFGGHRQSACGARYAAAPCGSYAAPVQYHYYPQAVAPMQAQAPQAYQAAPAAQVAQRVQPTGFGYSSYYYPAMSSCAGGSCAVR